MAASDNIVIFNQNKNKEIDEINRRLIAKIAPLCKAHNCHLILINYSTKESPIEFAENIAKSTSIGNSGKIFVDLAKAGFVKITTLPLPPNCGEKILCTFRPDKKKNNMDENMQKEKICLIFGSDNLANNTSKKMREQAKYHYDVSKKEIQLELDTEIGAVCNLIFRTKKA